MSIRCYEYEGWVYFPNSDEEYHSMDKVIKEQMLFIKARNNHKNHNNYPLCTIPIFIRKQYASVKSFYTDQFKTSCIEPYNGTCCDSWYRKNGINFLNNKPYINKYYLNFIYRNAINMAKAASDAAQLAVKEADEIALYIQDGPQFIHSNPPTISKITWNAVFINKVILKTTYFTCQNDPNYFNLICKNATNAANEAALCAGYAHELCLRDVNKALRKQKMCVARMVRMAVHNANKAVQAAQLAVKEADEIVATALLDHQFGKNTLTYSKHHDMSTARLLARMDTLISAVKNSSLSDPFAKIPSPDFKEDIDFENLLSPAEIKNIMS